MGDVKGKIYVGRRQRLQMVKVIVMRAKDAACACGLQEQIPLGTLTDCQVGVERRRERRGSTGTRGSTSRRRRRLSLTV